MPVTAMEIEAPPCAAHASTGRRWQCPDCRRLWRRAYHRRYHSQRLKPARQARRAQRLAQHRCTYCGRPLDEGDPYQRCAACRAYLTAKQRESRARRRTE